MNFKKYDYEIHKSLCNIGEVDEYLSECFPVGTKVRFAENEKKYTYYHNNLMEVVGLSKSVESFLLVSNFDNTGKPGIVHPNNLQIDIQENRRYKLKQLGIIN